MGVCAALTSYGQNRQVTGKVTSGADNMGLPSANVRIADTNQGVLTDKDGNYTITVRGNDDKLVFSYIGYMGQEIVVGNQSTVDVKLAEDLKSLSEVVVVGYGSQKKSDLTGAVGTVDAEEIGKFATGNAASTIQGRVAGVQVTSNGGAPGAGQIVTVRGTSTLSDSGPLYVIDGMLTGSMGSLNPQDIESVSVLKDASASAIYGSRAANGVIIVTTKKGRSGELKVDFDITTGIQTPTRYLPWANARQYADIVNRARDNDGNKRFPANDAEFDPAVDSDIQRESLRNAPMTNASLRFSGGSTNMTYALSFNYFDQVGIIRESDYKRLNVRANSTFQKGKFKLQETIGLTRSVNNPNFYFGRERDLLPTIPIRDKDGNFTGTGLPAGSTTSLGAYYGVGNLSNSLGLATVEDRTNKENGLIGNVEASYEIIKGLTYKLNLGAEVSAGNNYRFTPKYFFNATSLGNTNFAELAESNSNFLSQLIENTLNYNKSFGNHSLGLLAGQSSQRTQNRSLGVVARRFPSNDIRVASAAADRAQMPSSEYDTGLLSYFGRVNYTFNDRYLLTATIRRDGSSLFREDLRWGVFPSAAIGWNISNESFMQNVKGISNLKLRASYGAIGSNNVQAYAIDPELNLNSEYILGVTQQRVGGYSITKGVNSNITWETTKTTDIGLEFNAMNNKLQFTVDYFIRNSEDVLVNLSLPLYTGFGNPVPFNSASIRNKGFEFQGVYYGTVGNDFKFDLSGNFSVLNNVVTALGRATPIVGGGFTSNGLSSTRTAVGHPVAAFYGYVLDGIYQTDEEAKGANDSNSPRAGDLKFKDLNGDGKIDAADQDYIGNPTPNFIYGFNVNAQYKNFDFTLFFNGVAGNDLLNSNRYRGYFDTEGNFLADALNAWTPQNTETDIPRNTLSDPGYNRRMSAFYLESGAYFRLRNAQIGYNLPKAVANKLGMERLRIYLTTQNLFTITKYTGYYPEVGQGGRGGPRLFNTGVDEGAYPQAKNYQIGLQIGF
ncbi:SusC/RagA family TonB-linked outer membrane protein [Persicitalea jodogahamensis]|uniref:SusC/RagA family TonB-linked outer membrane protein n=2 Tax=Persicitalea jodogahamensis TaxID=402147 RepID=A0A8J3D970_9BACT|nr:SusC/RagA family TonB-linked outer membrane protein [Persicitalea jodogahamensis]